MLRSSLSLYRLGFSPLHHFSFRGRGVVSFPSKLSSFAAVSSSRHHLRAFRMSSTGSERSTESDTAVPPPPMIKSKIHHCQACGSPTKHTIPDGEEKIRAICTSCGRIHYENPKMVVGCLVEHDKFVTKAMSATGIASELVESTAVKPPSHPTYDLKAVIALALSEDAGDRGDITCLATIPKEMDAEATFIAKENGVIAGVCLAEMIFNQVDPSLQVEWSQKDGDHVIKGMQFGKVYGCARSIIVAERVVLNFMQRMSGIATLTKAMAEAAHPACILETRKTAPGLRLIDKWAVLIGGGKNHRLGLFDMVMIKDNHISVAGGVSSALKSVDEFLWKNNLLVPVEVETRTLDEVKEVLEYATENKTSLTRIMLDNMVVPVSNGDVDVSMLKDAVQLISGRFETEASGNVTLETVHKIGETGVTYISSGALTHSVKALDISLKIDTELALQVGRRTNRA